MQSWRSGAAVSVYGLAYICGSRLWTQSAVPVRGLNLRYKRCHNHPQVTTCYGGGFAISIRSLIIWVGERLVSLSG